MTATADLRTYILADAGIAALVGTRMFSNSVPEVYVSVPFIWYRQARVEHLDLLGETEPVPYREYFDLECVSTDLAGAAALAAAIKTRINGKRGVIGSGTYQAITVHDQYEDYQSRMVEADERLQVSALSVEVINQQ